MLELQFGFQIDAICDQHKIDRPVREYRFATELGRQWRFDFAWPKLWLAVECEGGTAKVDKYGKPTGAHNTVAGFRKDCHKYNAAVLGGWRLLRGDQEIIRTGMLARYAEDALLGLTLPTLRRMPKSGRYLPFSPDRLF